MQAPNADKVGYYNEDDIVLNMAFFLNLGGRGTFGDGGGYYYIPVPETLHVTLNSSIDIQVYSPK